MHLTATVDERDFEIVAHHVRDAIKKIQLEAGRLASTIQGEIARARVR